MLVIIVIHDNALRVNAVFLTFFEQNKIKLTYYCQTLGCWIVYNVAIKGIASDFSAVCK